MKTLAICVLAAIIWTQVTPSDDKGCAGYTPTIVRDDPPPQPYQPQQEIQEPRYDSGDDRYNSDSNDPGTGQINEPSQDDQW